MQGDFAGLALIGHVYFHDKIGRFISECLLDVLRLLIYQGVEITQTRVCDRNRHTGRLRFTSFGQQTTPRREQTRTRGNEDRWNPEVSRDAGCVKRASAAVSNEHRLVEWATLLERECPKFLGHHLIDRVHDRRRRLGDIHIQWTRNTLCDHTIRRAHIEQPLSLGQAKAIAQATENNVGIGHRCSVTLFSVTRRARVGPQAVRADVDATNFVRPHDRPSASADRGDVQHLYRDRKPKTQRTFTRQRRHAISHQTRIEARPTHITRHERPVTGQPA